MFFKKKKFYTLLDIKNQIVYTPLIFIFILSILSFLSIFLFLEYEKKNRITTLIQNDNFYKNDVLKSYVSSIKYNTSTSFDDVESDLSNYIFEIVGFIKANIKEKNNFNIELIRPYIEEIENSKGISARYRENRSS